MKIALFEPDIPQNTGSMIRLAACMGVVLHIVEPCGFPFNDKRMRRVTMDYFDAASIVRHISWQRFLDFYQSQAGARVIVLSAHATQSYTEFAFRPGDILLLGRESAGLPEHVKAEADAMIRIPMQPGVRSLNVALAASMVLGEALRQTQGFTKGNA